MAKFFVYKLTSDSGGAPCVTRDLLTLALCKPSVRSAAHLGDWIFGFGDNKLQNRLIYIAQVTGKTVGGAYYGTKAFHSRPDCIYWWTPKDTLKPKKKPHYHGSRKDALKDIGTHPEYCRANVLLSTNFRYFGDYDCKVKLSEALTACIHQMAQGHRSGGNATVAEAGVTEISQSNLEDVQHVRKEVGATASPRQPFEVSPGELSRSEEMKLNEPTDQDAALRDALLPKLPSGELRITRS